MDFGFVADAEEQAKLDHWGEYLNNMYSAETAYHEALGNALKDPEAAQEIMSFLTNNEKLSIVRRLAQSDDNLSAHPQIEDYINGYNSAWLYVGEPKTVLTQNPNLLNEYILDRYDLDNTAPSSPQDTPDALLSGDFGVSVDPAIREDAVNHTVEPALPKQTVNAPIRAI